MAKLPTLSPPPEFAPEQIKVLRDRNQASQATFARQLNTSTSTVRQWELGIRKPGPVAGRLLSLVEKHGLDILG